MVRLSKIYPKTGDDGTTGLGDGSRVGKDSARITAIGEVDELNSLLGLLLCESLPTETRELLIGIQHDLFDLGGELAVPGHEFLGTGQPARLEQAVERFNAELSPLKEFILPGGTPVAADAHFARAVCRRVERTLVALGKHEMTGDDSRRFVNRLSDLLFVLTRVLNRAGGRDDVYWRPAKPGG